MTLAAEAPDRLPAAGTETILAENGGSTFGTADQITGFRVLLRIRAVVEITHRKWISPLFLHSLREVRGLYGSEDKGGHIRLSLI